MSQAKDIREFTYNRRIAPVLDGGASEVIVRAGDVHGEMRLENRMPSVCAALSARAMEATYGLKLVERRGPKAGANVFFRFAPKAAPERTVVSDAENDRSSTRFLNSAIRGVRAGPPGRGVVLPDDGIYLVSCVKTKRTTGAAARDLYVSDWFKSARDFVDARCARWFVLSAKYGLLEPGALIEPYEETLKGQPIERRRKWAAEVAGDLLENVPDLRTVVLFAGEDYARFLIPELQVAKVEVIRPMARLRQGEQLRWLKRYR